jgi:trk system potassium uptake protein TrkA
MKNVIIIGSNSIAINIAETLCNNPDINLYIIESKEEKYYKIKDKLDAEFILGNEIDPDVLLRANIKTCDILLALSDIDSVNITVGLIARHFNSNVKIINHIDKKSEKNYEILNKNILNIDNFISPENLTSEHINQLLKHPSMIEYHKIVGGKFVITAFEVKDDSPILNKKLSELKKEFLSKYSMLIIGIDNENYFKIPKGDTTINKNDVLYFLIAKKHIKEVFQLFNIKDRKIEKILIGGGGRYSEALLDKISNKNYSITVLDRSKKRIEYLKELYPNVNYLFVDMRNMDRVQSKKLFDVDLYIAMTDNDNINFITSVYSMNSGTEVLSIYFDQNNFELFNHYKIKNVLNPKSLVIDELLSYFHMGKILSVSSLWNEEIEMVEFMPSNKSKLINKKLKELDNLDLLIGVIEHKGVASIANGESIIQENDKILFFAKKADIDNILTDIY